MAEKYTYRLVGVFPLAKFPFEHVKDSDARLIRGFIAELEKMCENDDLPLLDIPIDNYFSKDVYAREMKLPQGTLIVGKIHRHENLNILSEGEVSVLDEGGVRRIKAPTTFVAPPGTKRVIYAHTPVTWTTIHGTGERDLDKIEAEFIAKTYDDVVYIDGKDKKCLG
jgi:hypothetical protein